MKQILRLLIPALFSTSAFALNITPFLTCVTNDPGTATTTAYFGYESFEESVTTVPLGIGNRFLPPPTHRNQPAVFVPGYFEKAFRVTFPAPGEIFWFFNESATRAGSDSVPCSAAALPSVIVSLPYSQQLTAIGGHSGITWSPLGALPTGLTLSTDGLLSGTPQLAGQFSLTVKATDGLTNSVRQYGLLVGNGVTINDAVSTRAPGFTPQFRVVTNIAATTTATAACDVTEFVVTGGGACTVPSSNTVLGRIASSGPALNGWQLICSGGAATAVAVCSKQ